jgi:antitoxin HigA-1
VRLGHWLGTDPQFWLNLQTQYDLAVAEQQVGKRSVNCPLKHTCKNRLSGPDDQRWE